MDWDTAHYMTFDTETTGFRDTDRIVEIAFVEFKGGKIVDRFTSRVNPGIPIPEDASKIHGIYDADVRKAPHFVDLLPLVFEWMIEADCLLIAHNLAFDIRMLSYDMSEALWPPRRPTICTLQFAKNTHRLLSQKKKGHKLGDLATYFNLDFNAEAAHGAAYDAELLGRVVPRLLQGFDSRDISQPLYRVALAAQRR